MLFKKKKRKIKLLRNKRKIKPVSIRKKRKIILIKEKRNIKPVIKIVIIILFNN